MAIKKVKCFSDDIIIQGNWQGDENEIRSIFHWCNSEREKFVHLSIITVGKNKTFIFGRDYHKTKTERFFLRDGQIKTFKAKNVKTKKHIKETYLWPKHLIYIPPFWSFRFKLAENSILLVASTELYDKKEELRYYDDTDLDF